MPTVSDTALILALELIRKSGVREYESSEVRTAIAEAANELASLLLQGDSMALPDSFLTIVGNPISFADHAGDFSPAAASTLEHGTPTDCQLSMASVADGAARQSAKVDLGANRAEVYDVHAAFELAATPTAGDVIELWWNPSPSATAANANVGGCSGSDAAYAGYSSNMAAAIKQLQFIGDFVCTAQATGTVQIARVGAFRPKHRYGSLVVRNESGAAFHSDDVECHVIFAPQLPQVQD